MDSTQMSDPVDPLSDFSFLSLFPRTFHHCSLNPAADPRYADLLETVGDHLKSMALKSPSKLLEQAKSVLDGGMDVENAENVRSEDTAGDIAGVKKENLQGRRPALGRKRARFSFKQNSSQSVEFLEPFVDIGELPDPEEFFSAFEKHENAKNELKRQRGTALMDLDQNVPSMAERRRRPGLSRKSANYRHRFPMVPSRDDKAFLSSQETFSQDRCSPSNDCSQTENMVELSVGPAAARKGKLNDNRDELQAGHDEDDESDEILEMLQERFKPIVLNKCSLPDLTGAHRSEYKTLGKTLQDSQDKIAHLHDIVNTIGKEATLERNDVGRSTVHPRTLLKPPKSPYASISLLKARLFQSRQSKDPFSALDVDLLPLGKSACCEDTHDLAAGGFEKAVTDSLKIPHISAITNTRGRNLTSPAHENEGHMGVSKDTQDMAAAEFMLHEKSIKGNPMMPHDTEMHIELDHDITENDKRDMNRKSPVHEKESDTVLSKGTFKDISKDIHDSDAEAFAPAEKTTIDSSMTSGVALNTTPHIELDHDIMANDVRGRVLEDNPIGVLDDAVIVANERIELDGEVSKGDVQGPNMEKANWSKEQSTADAVEDLEKDRPSSDHDKLSTASVTDDLDHDRPSSSQAQAQAFKETQNASSKMKEFKRKKAREPSHARDTDVPLAERRKATAAAKQTRERKEFSRRKSLAACGTRWESGLRRRTRIRTRPLEYWKGERQLYGRIHESLITVIGTKYFSPTENGKPTIKVKSYVPDEYKEIVELAALH